MKRKNKEKFANIAKVANYFSQNSQNLANSTK